MLIFEKLRRVSMEETNEIIIYQSEDGATQIDVKFTGETVWLSQQQMSELYQTSRSNVVEHIKHIYEDHELDEDSTCRDFRQVRQEGSRQVTREIPFYNLDMIISLGYRICSYWCVRARTCRGAASPEPTRPPPQTQSPGAP